jgi:hypothetical protein
MRSMRKDGLFAITVSTYGQVTLLRMNPADQRTPATSAGTRCSDRFTVISLARHDGLRQPKGDRL